MKNNSIENGKNKKVVSKQESKGKKIPSSLETLTFLSSPDRIGLHLLKIDLKNVALISFASVAPKKLIIQLQETLTEQGFLFKQGPTVENGNDTLRIYFVAKNEKDFDLVSTLQGAELKKCYEEEGRKNLEIFRTFTH